MRRRMRFTPATCAVTLLTWLALTPLAGCDGLGQVKIMIPDFGSAEVRGVKLWKELGATGEFVPQTVYEFGETITQAGVEYVSFTVEDDRFEIDVPLAGVVTRDPDRPEALIVELAVVSMGEAATIRASTFNEAGESSLSQESAEVTL